MGELGRVARDQLDRVADARLAAPGSAQRMRPERNSALTSVVSPLGLLAMQRTAGNRAVASMLSRSSLLRNGDLRYRSPQTRAERLLEFKVGSRPAFFTSSPATHAVYSIDDVIYGLAGDFGGVSMGPDVGMQGYKWAGDPVGITPGEAEAFHVIAQNVASHMKYDLLSRNCFSPVVAALADLTKRREPDKESHATLVRMQEKLSRENFGLGQGRRKEDTKKNQ